MQPLSPDYPKQAFHIIIPARYASERLPGKMLLDIEGKPLIQRTFEAASRAFATSLTIATDHVKIFEAAQSFGASVLMTSKDHHNGSDRLAESVQILGLPSEAIVVNLQGDEPLVEPEHIWRVVQALIDHPKAMVATLSAPIKQKEELYNPNIVKIVTDKNGGARYFSRAPIPYPRDEKLLDLQDFKRHVGMYAYRVSALKAYQNQPETLAEKYEKLEQLRFLWMGMEIVVEPIPSVPLDVNTASDLEQVRKIFKERVKLKALEVLD